MWIFNLFKSGMVAYLARERLNDADTNETAAGETTTTGTVQIPETLSPVRQCRELPLSPSVSNLQDSSTTH